MFCENCGAELKNDDRFCGRCGRPIEHVEERNDVPSEVVTSDVMPDDSENEVQSERKEFSIDSIREDVQRTLAELEKPSKTICLFEDGYKKKKILGQKLLANEEMIAYFGEKLGGLNTSRVGVAFTTRGIRYNLMKNGVLQCLGLTTFAKGDIEYAAIKTIGLTMDSSGDWELFVNDKAIGRFVTGNGAMGNAKVADETTCELLSTLLDERTPNPIGSLHLDDAAQEFAALPKGFVVEDFLSGKASKKKSVPIVTLSLIGVCTVAFLYQLLTGSFENDFTLIMVAERLGAGSVLGYFICGFLHSGWIHMLSNMACLWSLGKSVERLFGKGVFLIVYLIGIWGGGFVADMMEPESLAVGASGGIFGLASVLFVYGGLRIVQIHRDGTVSRSVNKAIAKWSAENAVFLAQNIFFTIKFAVRFSISIGGHLGGLAAGAACGLILFFVSGRNRKRP